MRARIMIDGILCLIIGKSLKNILTNSNLDFKENRSRSEAKYKGLIITHYKETSNCILRGSIHKFYNGGEHNADLFTYKDFITALAKLETELNINKEDLCLFRMEIGINLPLMLSTKEYINCISEVNNRSPTERSKNCILLKYSQYEIKIYSKSQIYKDVKTNNIIRIEIAYKKKQKMTSDLWKLNTLEDLTNPNLWVKMASVLKKLINTIRFFDFTEITSKRLTPKEELTFYEWSNPVRIDQETNRSKVCRKRKQVAEIYHRVSQSKKAKEFNHIAKEKFKEVLNF